MMRRAASIVLAACAAVFALAAWQAPGRAAPAASLQEAYRAVSEAGALDAAAAAALAGEVEPVLAAVRDEDGLDLADRLRTARSAEERRRAKDDLEAHLRSLVSLESSGAQRVEHDRELLERIMAEEGVAEGAAAQAFLRRLQQQVLDWFERVVSRWFGSDAASAGLEAVYYVVLAASALVAAWLVWRVLSAFLGRSSRGRADRRRRAAGPVEPVVDAARDLPSDALAYAEAEARAGRFREAVRALFGGAARLLVERGAIPVARTRTTAEILHDVLDRAPAAHRPLAALAGVFEPAWYGHVDPGADGYAAARLAYLEVDQAAAAAGDRP